MTEKKVHRGVSNAPRPITPIQGGGYVRPTPEAARWTVWRLMPTVKLWQAVALSLDLEPTELLRDEALRGKPGRLLEQVYFDRMMVCQENVSLQGPITPQGGLYRGMLTDPCVKVLRVDVGRFMVQAGLKVPDAMNAGTPSTSVEPEVPALNSGARAHLVTFPGAPRARWTLALEHLLPQLEAQLKRAANTREVARYLKDNGASFYIGTDGGPDQLYWTTEQGDKKLVTKKTLQNQISEHRNREAPSRLASRVPDETPVVPRTIGESGNAKEHEGTPLNGVASMTFQPLPQGLSTKDAAHYLNRQPQTLRKWAAYESGPIRPLRINGRLMWRVADLQGLLGGAQPA